MKNSFATSYLGGIRFAVAFTLLTLTSAFGFAGKIASSVDKETGWTVHTLSEGNTTVKIAPDAGCNAFSMVVDGIEYFHHPEKVKDVPGVRCGNPILYPTPNRIRDGAFVYEGKRYRFKPEGKGNHIHGLVNSHHWQLESSSVKGDRAEIVCVAQFKPGTELFKLFPFDHTFRMTITVKEGSVRWTYEVDNSEGKQAVPFGVAFHPYIAYVDDRKDTYLTIPAANIMESPNLLPNGKLIPVDGNPLDARKGVSLDGYKADTVFFGMKSSTPAKIDYLKSKRRLTLNATDDFTHIVVWTPDRPYFGVENQTCSTDAHNMHAKGFKEVAHLQVCPAGKKMTGYAEYVVEETDGKVGVADANALQRATPESQGVSSAQLHKFITTLDKEVDSVNSVMLMRNGYVISEGWWTPYEANDPHMLYSLSKSFTSTAVGMAVAEGKLNVRDKVISYFPNQLPENLSEHLKELTIHDLLTMSVGHTHETAKSFSWEADQPLTKLFLSLPIEHKPGEHFWYNTPATYMCAAIVEKVTGEKLVNYLQPRLFEPLGIERPLWSESPQGIAHGGFGLNVRTRDIARFGQLYLQKGKWKGKQLIDPDWIKQATSKQVSNGTNPNNDWNQGYGYQFWRCRHNCYRGDGAFGQFCIVMPEHNAVLAITSGAADMGAIMKVAWDELLPSFKNETIDANPAEHRKLIDALDSLQLPTPVGSESSKIAAKVSGHEMHFADNPQGVRWMSIDFEPEAAQLVVYAGDKEHAINCGYRNWIRNRIDHQFGPDSRDSNHDYGVAASGAWTDDDTFSMKLCMYETPYTLTLDFHFGEKAKVDWNYNAAFGPKTRPSLEEK